MPRVEDLYRRAPIWLQTLAVSAYGLRLRRRRYGGIHRRALEELRRSQWFSADQLEAMQLAELRQAVRWAFADVPLYHRAWDAAPDLETLAGLSSLPTISKAAVQAPRESVIAARFRGTRLAEIHTGGTTGRTLTIYCTPQVLQRNYAFFARFTEWAGAPRRARVATFAGRVVVPPTQTGPPFWRRNLGGRQLLLSSYHLSERTLPTYVQALEAFRPDLIDSYPSSIEPIARYVLEHDIRVVRPKAVITSSETLSPTVRDLVTRAFGAPAYDYYGAAEMAAFIAQCSAGSYHPNPEFGIVEVLRGEEAAPAGQPGEIVATGLLNPVMPLIRYRTGDLAVRSDRRCECGRAFPVFERVIGRLDDVVITPDGRRIGRLDPILKAVASLYEARIIQDEEDHLLVEVVVPGGLPNTERLELIRQLRLRVGPAMRIDVAEVAAIPRTRSGKLRMVVNLVHPGYGDVAGVPGDAWDV